MTQALRCVPANPQPGPLAAGPELSDEQLAQSFTAIQGILAARTALPDLQANAEAIRAAVGNAPNVVDTGIAADCSVWIRFTDGSPLAIFDDRSGFDPSDPNPLHKPAPPSASNVGAALPLVVPAATGPFALPASAEARIGFSDNLAPHALPTVQAALQKRGYNVTAGATTADLRTGVSGVGVLWLSTHGMTGMDAAGVSHYFIATDEPLDPVLGRCTLSPAQCAANGADIAANRAGRGILQNGSKAFYAINDAWVKTYWTLAQDSVAFIDACNSMQDIPEVLTFRGALQTAHAGTVLGWRGLVDASFAEQAATFFFDRALGGDGYRRLTPPQRPFSVRESFNAMSGAGLITDPSGATLVLKHYATAEAILAPSIRNLTIVEKKTGTDLVLVGEFPATMGEVQIDGAPVGVSSWSSTRVVVTIPNKGAGSSGGVQARTTIGARTIAGNKVPLTSWRGTYRARFIMSGIFGAPGPYVEMNCSEIHFREDIHRYRLNPEEAAQAGTTDPAGNRFPFVELGNLTADSVCGGITDGSGDLTRGERTTRTWFSGTSTSLPWIDNAEPNRPPTWFFGLGGLDLSTNKLTLLPNALTSTTLNTQMIAPEVGPVGMISNFQASISPVVLTLQNMPIQLDGMTFGASQPTTPFTVPTPTPGDRGEIEFNFAPEVGTAPVPDTEG